MSKDVEIKEFDMVEYLQPKVSDQVRTQLGQIPSEVLELDVQELEELVKPTQTDLALKTTFQGIVNSNMLQKNQRISNSAIYSGICTHTNFYRRLRRTEWLAWLITPDAKINQKISFQGHVALNKITEMMSLNYYRRDGTVDPKTAQIVFNAAKLVYDRMFPQKSININQNTTVDGTKEAEAKDALSKLSDAELLQYIKDSDGKTE